MFVSLPATKWRFTCLIKMLNVSCYYSLVYFVGTAKGLPTYNSAFKLYGDFYFCQLVTPF